MGRPTDFDRSARGGMVIGVFTSQANRYLNLGSNLAPADQDAIRIIYPNNDANGDIEYRATVVENARATMARVLIS
jgi:hypothetical protein